MSQLSEFRIDDQLLAQSDALLAAIVRSATDAIIAVDATGTVISWNRGAQIHFGYPEREMIGLPLTRFIPPDRVKEQETALRRVFAGELIASFHSVRIARNGHHIAVSVSLSPIHDIDGNVVAASAIIRPRRHARRKLADDSQGNLWSCLISAPDEATKAAGTGREILVVENETLIGLGIAAMLENAGFNVIGPVADLHSAMSRLDERDCGLAILDINLAHGESSAPLAERLKRSGIPFLVTSGNVATQGPHAFDGARNLPRPVGARTLIAAVQEALG